MATVSSGQTLSVTGTDNGDIILSGGTEIVSPLPAGTSINPILSGGVLFDGNVVSGAQVSSGGVLFDGKTANNTIVSAGGTMFVGTASISGFNFSGSASGTQILSGGTAFDGFSMTSTTVSSGGVFDVGGPASFAGITSNLVASANSTVIVGGGVETVFSGSKDLAAQIRGGTQYDYSLASGVTVSGGAQVVDSGGTANGTTLSSGGAQFVTSGTASGTVVSSGGVEIVTTGGSDVGARIGGGTEIISFGGVATGDTIVTGSQVISSGGTARRHHQRPVRRHRHRHDRQQRRHCPRVRQGYRGDAQWRAGDGQPHRDRQRYHRPQRWLAD
jgi:fibronectin-binding autotransporter adhesin